MLGLGLGWSCGLQQSNQISPQPLCFSSIGSLPTTIYIQKITTMVGAFVYTTESLKTNTEEISNLKVDKEMSGVSVVFNCSWMDTGWPITNH